jgi:hypothetical protein
MLCASVPPVISLSRGTMNPNCFDFQSVGDYLIDVRFDLQGFPESVDQNHESKLGRQPAVTPKILPIIHVTL